MAVEESGKGGLIAVRGETGQQLGVRLGREIGGEYPSE
jgi:hypothetical protein